jgi:hypothetical protein
MASKTRKASRKTLAQDFCRCIKKVRKTIRLKPGQPKTATAKEAAAIAVCVKAVLQTRGRTLKRFKCLPKPELTTQSLRKQKGGVLTGTPPGGSPPNIPELPATQPLLQRETASQVLLGNNAQRPPQNRNRNNGSPPGNAPRGAANLIRNFGQQITSLFQ